MTKKSAFTLLEIMIVILIISSVYYIAATNLSVNKAEKKENLSLINIKKLLQGYSFEQQVQLKCVDEDNRCFVLVDGSVVKELDTKLFEETPFIYTYDTKLDTVEFSDLELEKLETFRVVFEYSIDKYNKTKDMIVEVNDKVYIFNSIKDKPVVVDYLSDVNNYFDDKISEVKDAF
jgi:prepilin-type N-terminal cleavage/methylation domain-containing protein